jgi:hypothetical protein
MTWKNSGTIEGPGESEPMNAELDLTTIKAMITHA